MVSLSFHAAEINTMTTQGANPELITTSEVIHRRVANTKRRVCEIAAQQFNSTAVDAVSIESICSGAGIARSTFYRFFDDKEDLLRKIITPVFEQACEYLHGLDPDRPEEIVNGIAGSYLRLWRDQPDTLILSGNVGAKLFELVAEEHNVYADIILHLMHRLHDARMLRNDDPRLSAVILAQTAVCILQVCQSHPQFENVYRGTLRGMILKW